MKTNKCPSETGKNAPNYFCERANTTKCPVCGRLTVTHQSDYPSSVEPFASCTVYYCSSCGSGHVPGVGDLLKRYYQDDYAALNRGDRDIEPVVYFSEEFRKRSPKISRYFIRSSRHIEILQAFNASFNHVLDFGSGPGYFLHLSRAKNKFAFEPDQRSAKYLSHIGAHQFQSLPEIRTNEFDVIVSSHTLEHLPAEDLHTTLSLLVDRLKLGGKLLIEVPHGGHSFVRLNFRQDPHTLFFSPEGIVSAVESAGGRVLYRKAFAKEYMPARDSPIYKPKGSRFNSERRGSLTIVCERRADSWL